jgi:N-hydroxyarylamine O-acetyltransferase
MERSEITTHYLQALGLTKKNPTLPFLHEITELHVSTFAFCSIGPRLGLDLPLDLNSLFERIVLQKRGGYCFEQNGLLFEILDELGFSVKLYLARVVYNQDIHPGLTHRISIVKCEGEKYVVDVGFGPLGPRAPVKFKHEDGVDENRFFRLSEPQENEFHMQTMKDGDFFSLYKFELAQYGQADCEIGHFFSHKHPKAVFVNNLVASRIMKDEIRSLRNQEYWILRPSGDVREKIENSKQLHNILKEQFDIQITETESIELARDFISL